MGRLFELGSRQKRALALRGLHVFRQLLPIASQRSQICKLAEKHLHGRRVVEPASEEPPRPIRERLQKTSNCIRLVLLRSQRNKTGRVCVRLRLPDCLRTPAAQT